MKFITKPLLAEALKLGDEEGYNQRLDPQVLAQVDARSKHRVRLAMIHRHRAGQPYKAHARVTVDLKLTRGRTRSVLFDMPIDFFNALPGSDRINEEMIRADAIRSEAVQRTVRHVVLTMEGQSMEAINDALRWHLADLEQSLRRNAAA